MEFSGAEGSEARPPAVLGGREIAASASKQCQAESVIQEPAPLATLFSILGPLP